MKNFFKKSTKKIVKTAASTTGEILSGALGGIDEAINGDDVKEKRAERNRLRSLEKDRQRKVSRFNYYTWSLSFLAFIGLILHTILTSNGETKSIESILEHKGFLLLVPFLLAIMLTIFSDKFFK